MAKSFNNIMLTDNVGEIIMLQEKMQRNDVYLKIKNMCII